MREYLPLLIAGAIIGVFSVIFLVAYASIKNKKEAMGYERNMSDGEIIKRLLRYAKPYWKRFVLVGVVMLLSIAYDVLSPLLVGRLEELVAGDFELRRLYTIVAVYGGLLVVSLICTYVQAMVLQATGQRILSNLRQDLFIHIENLSHEQLNNIPVGKLVTRVTNDTNAISYLFTNILVTLLKNILVILGVLAAMLMLNYALTLMVLCFAPFLVLFTFIFRKFSRKAHRSVTNSTTDINTFLSENLSGMKITQIFNREEKKNQEFLERSSKLRKAKENRMFVFGIFRPMVYMLYISSILCLFYLGGKGYVQNFDLLGQTVTAGVVGLNLLPWIVMIMLPEIMAYTGIFWVMFGASAIAYFNAKVLLKMYKKHEPAPEQDEETQ